MIWSLLHSPVALKLTFVLLHFLWQAFFLICLWRLLASLLRLRTAEARYLGALATLAIMAVCPVATYLLLDIDQLPTLADFSGMISSSSQATSVSLHSPTIASLKTLYPTLTQLITSYQPYLMLGWLLGVALLGGRICLSYCGTIWLRSVGLSRVDSQVLVQFSKIAQQLNIWYLPSIAYSSRINQAMAVGLMRPMVLLPLAWMTEISPDVLEAVLAHELAHVKRRDLWVNFFQRVMETIFFYHPAVWLISAEIRRERESCCDELAIAATGERLDYAKSLHEVASRQIAGGPPVLAIPFLGQRTGELLTRVRRVLTATSPQPGERSWTAGLMLVVAPLCLCAIFAIVFPQTNSTVKAEDKSSSTKVATTSAKPPWVHAHPEADSPRWKHHPHNRFRHHHLPRKDKFGESNHLHTLQQFDLNSLDPEDQAMMRVLYDLRHEVRVLQEQVEDLQEESPRQRRKIRRLENLSHDHPQPTDNQHAP